MLFCERLILIIVIRGLYGTIDMNIPEFEHIANHLTTEECIRLVASLHFTSYDLPAALSAAERKVPDDVPCINLLLNWNSGTQPWEGRGKTHEEIEHRLRQIGKVELADWLGKTVFHELAKEINDTFLNRDPFEANTTTLPQIKKLFKDEEPPSDEEEWTTFDSIVWMVVFMLVILLVLVVYKIIRLTIIRVMSRRRASPHELVDLINNEESSDDEVVYEEKKKEHTKIRKH